MDTRRLEEHYQKALNGLFASLQAIKYKRAVTIETKIEALSMWIGYLEKMKRYLVFMQHNQPPKELT